MQICVLSMDDVNSSDEWISCALVFVVSACSICSVINAAFLIVY